MFPFGPAGIDKIDKGVSPLSFFRILIYVNAAQDSRVIVSNAVQSLNAGHYSRCVIIPHIPVRFYMWFSRPVGR